jgi:site-specific DNA recombinase
MILGSQAKLENDNKSVNVKRGLRMRCEMGLWPAPAPTGYLNEKRIDRKGYVTIDTERAHVVKEIFEKVAYEHWSGRKIYHWLKFDLNFKTATSGKNLTLSNVYLLLQNTFYYGVFEYPAGSGNWYTGRHEPIISKELFEKAKEQLKRDHIVRSEMKEFAFTKLMTCGLCGSGITAEEKYKQLKDGTTARYVYYGCSRAKDKNCKNQYMREEDVIQQLVAIMDNLDLDETEMKGKFEEELNRLNKFQKAFLGMQEDQAEPQKVDLRAYAKHIFTEGSTIEKRELLGCIKCKLTIQDKLISL